MTNSAIAYAPSPTTDTILAAIDGRLAVLCQARLLLTDSLPGPQPAAPKPAPKLVAAVHRYNNVFAPAETIEMRLSDAKRALGLPASVAAAFVPRPGTNPLPPRPGTRPRQLSPAARDRISQAQRRRWRKFHREQKAAGAGKTKLAVA